MIGTSALLVALAWSASPEVPGPKSKAAPPRASAPIPRGTILVTNATTDMATRQIALLPPAGKPASAAVAVSQPPQPLPPPPPAANDQFDAPITATAAATVPSPPAQQPDSTCQTPCAAMPCAPPACSSPFSGQVFAEPACNNAGYPAWVTCPQDAGEDDDDDDGCCVCGPDCPGDLYPHYAYFPQYHGHYYFRPYNYTTVLEQQQWATCAGLDPRNPYSNKVFECVLVDFVQRYGVASAPVGTALPSGNGLPQLEQLLAP